MLSSTSKETLKNYALQDSHYQVSNIPRKVGYIKVYFDEENIERDAYEYFKQNNIHETSIGYVRTCLGEWEKV